MSGPDPHSRAIDPDPSAPPPEPQGANRPAPPPPASDWALFLDVDGCLLEFADSPMGVVVPADLRQRLFLLSERLDGALALVSGRSLQALDELFWPLRLPAAGLHGLELRTREGRGPALEPEDALQQVRGEAYALANEYPGALVENKQLGIALHWRAAPQAAAAMHAFAQSALARLPNHRLQPGDKVLELLPAGSDKGSAIAALLAQAPFAGRVPVFAGDDLTDESGFAVINQRGGISVLVGERDSAATHGLADPLAVRRWLDS